jgi:hypothetical protein
MKFCGTPYVESFSVSQLIVFIHLEVQLYLYISLKLVIKVYRQQKLLATR